jgi:hypothetical protein
MERFEATHGSRFLFCWICLFNTLIFSALLSGLTLFALERAGIGTSVEVRWVILALASLPVVAWAISTFRRPTKSSLVLYARGLRYRTKSARFEDLVSIRLGRDLSKTESAIWAVNKFFAMFHGANAHGLRAAEVAGQGSLALVYRDGQFQALKGALIRPVQEDPQRFLDHVVIMAPGLLDDWYPPPEESPPGPGIDDLGVVNK